MDGTWCKVGRNQLLAWMKSGRVTDPNVDWDPFIPEVGDTVAVGCARGEHVYIRAAVCKEDWASGDEDYDIWLTDQFQHNGFDIWDVVDDSEGLYGYHRCEDCGRWVFEFDLDVDIDDGVPGEWFSYRWYCHDWKGCEEFRTRAATPEALHQLRQAGSDSPIHYDVMRYNSAAGKFQCVGSNLRFWEARDLVRRFERGGFVSFLRESQAVVSNG